MNNNTVKWGKPVKTGGVYGCDLAYVSKCGRFTITKGHLYDAKIANCKSALRAAYSITDGKTGETHGCSGLSGGREWAEHIAARVA